jgi:hypothetical protein
MGNSDSKSAKHPILSTPSSKALAQEYKQKVEARLEAEFEKRADLQYNALSQESFQTCLRKIQNEFGLFNISGSPLSVGLFHSVALERPAGKPLMTKPEYASAMELMFHTCEQSVLISATTQAILRWYGTTKSKSGTMVSKLTDEILVAFFEASWRFAWNEMTTKKLGSNIRLNGKAESEAIERFMESHTKYFATHPNVLKLYDATSVSSPAVDRSLTVRVGEESVTVPTSFSFLSKSPISVSPRSSVRPDSSPATNSRTLYPYL